MAPHSSTLAWKIPWTEEPGGLPSLARYWDAGGWCTGTTQRDGMGREGGVGLRMGGHMYSCVPWTVVHQAPPSMGFSRLGYWIGLPFPPPGDLPDPGIKLTPPALQSDSLPLSHQGSPHICVYTCVYVVVVQSLSHVRLFVIPWTVAHVAPLSMGFPRQEYWSGLPFFFSRGSS